jgi:hypothetical protein
MKKQNQSSARLAQRMVDEVLQADVIFQYLDGEAPGKMQELCVAINENYLELLEEQFRSDGKNADVEASLNDIEEQLKFPIGVAFGRRVSNG